MIRILTDDDVGDLHRYFTARLRGERYDPPSDIERARRRRQPPTYDHLNDLRAALRERRMPKEPG